MPRTSGHFGDSMPLSLCDSVPFDVPPYEELRDGREPHPPVRGPVRLSMDYEFFLITRMQESWIHTDGSSRSSVAENLACSGRVEEEGEHQGVDEVLGDGGIGRGIAEHGAVGHQGGDE